MHTLGACRVRESVSSPTHGQEGTPALLLAHVVHEARCCKYLRPCSRRAPRVSRTCLGRSNLCRAPCGLCRPNPYANAHTYTRAYAHACRDSQSHRNAYGYCHAHPDSHSHPTAHRDSHADDDANTHAYTPPDANAHPDSAPCH